MNSPKTETSKYESFLAFSPPLLSLLSPPHPLLFLPLLPTFFSSPPSPSSVLLLSPIRLVSFPPPHSPITLSPPIPLPYTLFYCFSPIPHSPSSTPPLLSLLILFQISFFFFVCLPVKSIIVCCPELIFSVLFCAAGSIGVCKGDEISGNDECVCA